MLANTYLQELLSIMQRVYVIVRTMFPALPEDNKENIFRDALKNAIFSDIVHKGVGETNSNSDISERKLGLEVSMSRFDSGILGLKFLNEMDRM